MFYGYRCPNHTSATTLGLCYENYDLKGRFSHNNTQANMLGVA